MLPYCKLMLNIIYIRNLLKSILSVILSFILNTLKYEFYIVYILVRKKYEINIYTNDYRLIF